MRLTWLISILLVSGCEIFPESTGIGPAHVSDQPPIFEFSYSNSVTLPGWIRYRNHCAGIVKYKWYLGFNDETGHEAISFGSAPKVKYPKNGYYRVIVEGIAYDDTKFQKEIAIEVYNY